MINADQIKVEGKKQLCRVNVKAIEACQEMIYHMKINSHV